jgi:heme exporter protein A
MSPSASLYDATVVLDDRLVLRRVSVEIGPGLTVLRGPNGAGKTTLLRALAGLVPLARGTRRVSSPPLFIGQRSMLLRGLSARQNLEFLAAFRGQPGTGAADALHVWGLGSVMDQPVERLSAGERHRASLARLLTEPTGLVLLDEPFSELDRGGVELVLAAIAEATSADRSVLLVTHAHQEVDGDAVARVHMDGGALVSG